MYTNRMHLIEKIILGEDSTMEFKREMPHRNSLADEIAAFANTQGGVILIGVDDYSEIVGLELQELDRVEKRLLKYAMTALIQWFSYSQKNYGLMIKTY